MKERFPIQAAGDTIVSGPSPGPEDSNMVTELRVDCGDGWPYWVGPMAEHFPISDVLDCLTPVDRINNATSTNWRAVSRKGLRRFFPIE